MKNDKQQRWNEKYSEKEFAKSEPAFVLSSNQHLLVQNGTALDIACGFGANALFLASKNFHVDAIDYSSVAIEKLAAYAAEKDLAINPIVKDLEAEAELGIEKYDVIAASYYLQRSLFSQLIKALKPGGLLFYQTFAGAPVNGGPANPAFRLQPGELLTLCSQQSILFYREDNGHCSGDKCFNGEAMIVVSKLAGLRNEP